MFDILTVVTDECMSSLKLTELHKKGELTVCKLYLNKPDFKK